MSQFTGPPEHLGHIVPHLGFGVQGLGFRVLGFIVPHLGFRVWGSGFGVCSPP